MTEADWNESTDPLTLMQYMAGLVSSRKLRLLMCAWGHDVFPNILDDASWNAVFVAERYADGSADRSELMAAYQDALSAWKSIDFEWGGRHGKSIRSGKRLQSSKNAADVARHACDPQLCDRAIISPLRWRLKGTTQYRLVNHIRDLFGNPFRPVAVDPAWLTSTAVAIAHGIYDDRAFDRLPILADALQDAGCENDDILSHCRSEGPHVRGCWVVDLVLGKE